LTQYSYFASDAASRFMTVPRLRVTHWALALSLAGLASITQTGTAKAQFFDPFSYFFAPQAPAYAPPVIYRRGPRFSRRSRPVLVWVPDRPRVRRARAPERVRHVSLPHPVPARIRPASLPGPAPVQKRRSSEPSAVKEKVREERKIKLVPREPLDGPVAALMKDTTLRRGDVVVLPDGPKVFKGGRTGWIQVIVATP
jgi:hypothetical protein